ncbi:MAG: trypsin-like peptidase domain-containing protein [bacterium]|nr:trypsin-like peptidase domain-containing protein [bacterium]
MRVLSVGAVTISFNYDKFYLPEGARLFVFNPNDTSECIGAFTHRNNKPSLRMASGMVRGDDMILELYEPAVQAGKSILSVSSVVHGYRGVSSLQKGYGDAAWCQIDVNCEEGDPYWDQIRSVVMFSMSNNTRVCSGSLLNNETEDETPYILSTAHCYLKEPDSMDLWTFYFNYQSALCDSADDGSLDQSLVGATKIASFDTSSTYHYASDFVLFLLDDSVPDSYNAFFAGWSNSDSTPTAFYVIHHPKHDVKKISFGGGIAECGYSPIGCGNQTHHWFTSFHVSHGDGMVQPGSSGSPLFDQDGRIIGQLSDSSPKDTAFLCSGNDEWQDATFGKFSVSWDSLSDTLKQLAHWLDPDNTGATYIDGLDPNENCCSGIRGDVDYSQGATEPQITDLTYLVDYLYNSDAIPQCTEEGNVDGDSDENIDEDDKDYLVAYLFLSGPAPPSCP